MIDHVTTAGEVLLDFAHLLLFFFLKLVAHIKSLLAGSGVKKLTGVRVYQGIFICPTGQCGHLEYVSLLLFISLAL